MGTMQAALLCVQSPRRQFVWRDDFNRYD